MPKQLDTIGWFICTLHQALGHRAAATVVGDQVRADDMETCILCRYDRGEVTKADVIERLGK
jgi:hypothetical protein